MMRDTMKTRISSLLLLSLSPLTALAEPWSGTLLAARDCPAGISTKHSENPGNVRLVPGETYPVVARNKPQPTHVQLRMDVAQPKDRWVEVGCGRLVDTAAGIPANRPAAGVEPAAEPAGKPTGGRTAAAAVGAPRDAEYLFAVTWQPAFCEPRPDKPECRALTPQRPAARQFSLHGLWPQPKQRIYCGVAPQEREAAESGAWKRLPAPALSPATRGALEQQMPGTASYLDRHEWTKHGTCHGTDAETYFRHSLALLEQLNGSQVRQLFESNTGQRLGAEAVRAALDRSFGPGSGERLQLQCDQDGLITELRINLKGTMTDRTPLGNLIAAAQKQTGGCRAGWVDAAGPGR